MARVVAVGVAFKGEVAVMVLVIIKGEEEAVVEEAEEEEEEMMLVLLTEIRIRSGDVALFRCLPVTLPCSTCQTSPAPLPSGNSPKSRTESRRSYHLDTTPWSRGCP